MSTVTTAEVEAFLCLESRLLDEARYEEWLDLWTEDGIYWVPIGSAGSDPRRQVSILYDDHARLSQRVRRMRSEHAWALSPRPASVRVLSNVELSDPEGTPGVPPTTVEVDAAGVIAEARAGQEKIWFVRLHYGLRRVDEQLRLRSKRVHLLNSDGALATIGVLL